MHKRDKDHEMGEIHYPHIRFASDQSILITLGQGISRDIHAEVYRLFHLLSSTPIQGLRNIHPAYHTILISYDPMATGAEDIAGRIQSLIEHKDSFLLPHRRRVEIPVCYGESWGPDLAYIAEHRQLTVEQVIHSHSNREYLVYFLGFSPGFPYLGEMPMEIAVPRLPTPRRHVPAGSVAIGGKQTGIYPVASPGGWRIIGRTPKRLFFPERYPPTLLQMGDIVCFTPISQAEFLGIQKEEDFPA